MSRDSKWARCNLDGKPIHPDDQKVIDAVKQWLRDRQVQDEPDSQDVPPEG